MEFINSNQPKRQKGKKYTSKVNLKELDIDNATPSQPIRNANSSHGTPAKLNEKKRKRREQNRVAAQLARRKRNNYVTSLEAQIKDLNERIKANENTKELNVQINRPGYCACDVNELKRQIDDTINHFMMALKRQETLLVNSSLEKLKTQYEGEDVKRVIDGLLNSLVQCIVPRSFGRLLWMAKNKVDVFAEDFLLYTEDSKGESNTPNNDVSSILNLKQEDKAIIRNVEEELKMYEIRLRDYIVNIKDNTKKLIQDTRSINRSLSEKVLPKLDVEIIAKYLNWIMNNPNKINFYNILNESKDSPAVSELSSVDASLDFVGFFPEGRNWENYPM